MFNFNKIYALIMGNFLKSCKEDVSRLKNFLDKYNSKVVTCTDCFPQKEILKFLHENKISEKDLFLIHFSGHGKNIGRKINGKMQMLSTWVNPDESLVSSFNIDKILSNLECKILLTSDSCHSGKFGDFFTGKYPFIFIGSSSIIEISKEYNIGSKEKTGVLVCLLEFIFDKLQNITFDELLKISKEFFKKNNIKKNPVIKIKNFKENNLNSK